MMIAARNAFLMSGGSSTPTARDYVQDGLVAMWDGIENAGWGQHDANAVAWNDLIGNNDITIHRPDYCLFTGDCLRILPRDNINCGVAWGTNDIHALYSTIQVIFTAAFPLPRYEMLFWPGYNRGMLGLANANASGAGGFHFSGLSGNKSYYPTNTSGVICATGVFNSTSANLPAYVYDGATPLTPNNRGTDMAPTYRHIILGSRAETNDAYYFEGDIYCVRLYSTSLTAAEVAANYAVDAARFGL